MYIDEKARRIRTLKAYQHGCSIAAPKHRIMPCSAQGMTITENSISYWPAVLLDGGVTGASAVGGHAAVSEDVSVVSVQSTGGVLSREKIRTHSVLDIFPQNY